MVAVWLAVVLLLVPGMAAGQTGSPVERQAPATTPPEAQPPATQVPPQTQPPATPVSPQTQPPATQVSPQTQAPATQVPQQAQPPATQVSPQTEAPATQVPPQTLPPTTAFPERQPRTTPPPEPLTPATTVPLQVPGLVIGVTPPGAFPVNVSPRTPPPVTIRSGAEVILPTAPPGGGARPTRLFEFRPTVGVSEEYIDNFTRSQQSPQANYRSTVTPGLQVLLDYGSLTGSAAYTLSAFYDSLTKTPGFQHSFAGLLAWQATPLLRLSVSESLLESDNPAQADRLQLNQTRQTFTTNQFSLTSEYSLGMFDTREYYRRSDFTSPTSTTQSNTLGLSVTRNLDRIHVVTAGYEHLTSDTTPGTAAVGAASASTLVGHQITASFSRDLTAYTTAGISGAYAVRDQQAANGSTSFSRRSLTFFNNYTLTDKLLVRSDIGLAQLTTGSSSSDPLMTSTTNISYWLGPATITLGLERGFAETFGQGENLGVVKTSGYTLSMLYRFTPLLSSQISGTYRENEFTGTGGGTAGQSTTVYTAQLNVTYQIARWLTGTIEAAHTNSQSLAGSSAGQGSFTENRVRASLNAILY